ncbi:uncharacterized protein RSE6_07194 [Rhynchosporium secalis]|uniref:Uncharacterized protein n=1 Tax=Rhynchosporium secalis TaxID=38038 RepID=A0A1E1MDA4_RHYSE|nr:uncharacterized protein RSE6_07194 [Rhynchosporium secalis]
MQHRYGCTTMLPQMYSYASELHIMIKDFKSWEQELGLLTRRS